MSRLYDLVNCLLQNLQTNCFFGLDDVEEDTDADLETDLFRCWWPAADAAAAVGVVS